MGKMQLKISKGPWRRSQTFPTAIISNDCEGLSVQGSKDIESYGGCLVCESVSSKNVPAILALPDMLEALAELSRVQHEQIKKGGGLLFDSDAYHSAFLLCEAAFKKANR